MDFMIELIKSITDLFDSVIKLCIAAIVPVGMAVLTSWLMRDGINKQVQAKDNQWRADRKEKAYLECLTQLTWSQRKPVRIADPKNPSSQVDCLEKESYLGAMASFQHIPTWLIMIQNLSSSSSRNRIQPHREEIIRIFKDLKLNERNIISHEGKEFVRELGMCEAVEKAFLTVSSCSEVELKA